MALEAGRASTGAVQTRRGSILVAVEPVVLEGALAFLIERAHQAEVVQFHASAEALTRRYDAAVVSDPAPGGVHADVVITLPAVGAAVARVSENGETHWAPAESHHQIIHLLAEHAHVPARRTPADAEQIG